MRKRIGSILWGIFFLGIGIGIAGAMLGAWTFTLFFDGWWTLFLIVPAIIAMVEHGPNSGNLLGLTIGLLMLACARGNLAWSTFGKLIVPVVLIVIGLGMVLKSVFSVGGRRIRIPNADRTSADAVFGGKRVVLDGACYGVDGDAVFGGLTIDLRNAVVTQDISMDVSAIFGGVKIFLPPSVRVVDNATALFGGCNNRRGRSADGQTPVVYVNALAMFGGVEIC